MFLSPWGLLGLIAIPLILLLYILKQKREKLTVSSLVLWQQVLRDMQARTPWQKLRKNLLMFLQLLAALLLVLALAGLALQFFHGDRESVILVIDTSLSMSSTDIQPTRLNAAKKDALQYVKELPNNSRITVVTIAREADVLLYASESADEAVRSIQAIEPTNTYMDPAKAEELLLSLKKQDQGASIVLFGDKPITVGSETIQFSGYERQNNNLALVRFNHTRSKDSISAMSIVRNQGDTEAEASVSLYGDGEFLDSQRVVIKAHETQTIWWQEIPPTVTELHCVIDTEDILEADNHAYDTVLSDDPVKVLLVTEGNYFLEKIFSLIQGVELVRTLPEEVTVYNGYDLYVLDGTIPEKLPADGNIVIFAPKPNSLFPVGDWMDTPAVQPVKHAIFRYLDKLSFAIGRTRILEKPQWAETIMEANGNPIILDGRLQNTRILIFGFHLYETDLPLKSEFPILISNIISEYSPGSGNAISGVLIGDAVSFSLQPDTQSAKLILPSGETVSVAPPIPPEPFLRTDAPGIYRLEQKKIGETVISSFTVNLPDEWQMEKSRTSASAQDVGMGASIPVQKSAYPLTFPLLALAVLILLLEWWYYANRNYV
jgi:hypothetical protein